jgi:phosphoglycerol geranylgeranyltransferase
MKEGNVYRQIAKISGEGRTGIFTVIDPPNQKPEEAGVMAKAAHESGVAGIAVGGSTDAQGELLDRTIREIKKNCPLPVILFPGNIATLSRHADAVYFMYMMNSQDPYYITGAQVTSAMQVKKLGIEVMPTAYSIVEPGRAVGWVGRAKLIPRELPYLGAVSCLAGEYMGAKLAILESGGGAPGPAPAEMIAAAKKLISIPLIVAGGVRNEKYAEECAAAGADILHVGTAAEECGGRAEKLRKRLTEIVKAADRGAKRR